MDHDEFERIAVSLKGRIFKNKIKKHNGKQLPELTKRQLVWVKETTDAGQKHTVQMKELLGFSWRFIEKV